MLADTVRDLAGASVGIAIMRSWGHFTPLGFLDYLAQDLVGSLFMLPILLSFRVMRAEAASRRRQDD